MVANLGLALLAGVLLFVFVLGFHATRQFGSAPSGARLDRIQKSPQYDAATQGFVNQDPRDFRKDMPFFKMLREFTTGSQIRTPTAPLPSSHPDVAKLLEATDNDTVLRYTWLGHSCVLMRMGGKTILLDPTMTERVSPVSFFGNRFQPPPLKLDELPPIDYVVVSHDHYDHLDANSIRFFARPENQTSRIITALGVGARLESFGIKPERIVELDWWESFTDQGFTFTATPSQHFSGRSFNDNAKTLWMGIAIRHGDKNIFFSGDSGYFTHFKAIGEKLGPFDFAVMESGQYNLLWHYVHMLPEEVVQASKDIRTKAFMPIHWGMYNLALHDWFEPVARVFALAQKEHVEIRTPTLGEIVTVSRNSPAPAPTKWWESHPDYVARHAP